MTTDGGAPAPSWKARPDAGWVRVFSLSARIGRLRYLVYTLVVLIVCSFLLALAYALARSLSPQLGNLLATIALVFLMKFTLPLAFFVLTMRRLHDFNYSGWWALALVLPVTALIPLFVPGGKSSNRFGPPPPSHSEGLYVAAIVAPVILIWATVAQHRPQGASPASAAGAASAQPAEATGLRSYKR